MINMARTYNLKKIILTLIEAPMVAIFTFIPTSIMVADAVKIGALPSSVSAIYAPMASVVAFSLVIILNLDQMIVDA
jgi:hypothetical protein